MSFVLMMLGGIALDIAVGWPPALFAWIGHPVTWVGGLITRLEAGLNNGPPRSRRLNGTVTCAAAVLAIGLPALALQAALPENWIGILIGAICVWPFIAIRSMYEHVRDVADPLEAGDLQAARRSVSMIVGRNPDHLDEAGIARASLESLAENTSDGIVAPVFWGCIAGLPGIAAYKAINTLDSMIGHRTERYEDFGKVSARLDDVVNWIPARVTGALFALASTKGPAFRVMLRDAPKHRSPNAGWPEAAMAGGLNIRLSGPRIYDGRTAEEPWLNPGFPDPGAVDIRRGLGLYRRLMALGVVVLSVLSLI